MRYDDTIEAYEIIHLTCELLSERAKLIASVKECPQDLQESIATLIWSSNVIDVPELIEVRKLFRSKYGAKFIEQATTNTDGHVNERVVQKLSIMPPTAYIVQTYLERIAEQFEIDWEPSIRLQPEDLCRPTAAPTGYSVMTAPGSGLVTSTHTLNITSQTSSISRPTQQATTVPCTSDIAVAIPVPSSSSSSVPSKSSVYAPLYTPLPEPDIILAPSEVLLNSTPNVTISQIPTAPSVLPYHHQQQQQDNTPLSIPFETNDDMTDLQRRLAQLQHKD